LTKVIHISSTGFVLAVENFLLFRARGRAIIHKILDLSTNTVDKLFLMWIIFRRDTVISMFYAAATIRPVDKPVDNRGRSCG
jgi:hypothetical protein